MSPVNSPVTDFEHNARRVLEESISRVDARTRSRLNQARQLAVEAAGARHRPWWRSFSLMPAAGAVTAALLLGVMLWHREPAVREPPLLEGRAPAVEDIDLLAAHTHHFSYGENFGAPACRVPIDRFRAKYGELQGTAMTARLAEMAEQFLHEPAAEKKLTAAR